MRRRRRQTAWLWGSLIALVGLLLVLLAVTIGRGRVDRQHRQAVRKLVAEAEAAVRSKELDRAVTIFDQALNQAGAYRLEREVGLIRERRAQVARQNLTARLEAAAALPPSQAESSYEALCTLAANDPDLIDLRGAIAADLVATRRKLVDEELSRAEAAAAAGQFDRAVTHAARAWKRAGSEAPMVAARGIVTRAVTVLGIVAEPVSGQFLFGKPDDYDTALRRPLLENLKRQGYLEQPDIAAWSDIWEQHAPYRLRLRVDEQPTTYLQSANRATRATVEMALTHHGKAIWGTTLTSQTRTPPPGMPAYEASILAVASKPSPRAERRLFEDALAVLRDRVALASRSLPGPNREYRDINRKN